MRQEDIERIDELSKMLNLSKSEIIRLGTIALADHIRLEKKMMEPPSHNVQYENKENPQHQYRAGATESSSLDALFYHEDDIRETLEIAKTRWVED